MNIPNLALFSLGCCLLLSHCTSSLKVSAFNPVPPIYEQGNAVLISKKKNEVMVRLLSDRFSGATHSLPEFLVVVNNRSKSIIDFSTDNVTAMSGEKSVRIFTYEKLRKRIETEAAIQAFAAAMNGASQSISASMPQQSYHSGSAYAYGSGGYTRATYTGTTTTYNPAASAIARSNIQANTSNQISSIAMSRDAALGDTTSMLRRDTIMPGAFAGGVVKMYGQDLRRGKPLKITVQIQGELHDFYFDVGR